MLKMTHTCTSELFVSTVLKQYTTLVRQCFKGRDKYSNLLVNWMDFVRNVLYEADSPASVEWTQLEKKTGLSISKSTRSAVITLIQS